MWFKKITDKFCEKKNKQSIVAESKSSPILRVGYYEPLFKIDIAIGKRVFTNAMKCIVNEDTKTILIADIYVGNEPSSLETYLPYVNKGYGTLLMNELLHSAKKHDCKLIKGVLSEVDSNTAYDPTHRQRQIHFYKKFGFKVLPNEETPDSIELILSDVVSH